jgi:hypothetical protein
MPAAIVIGLLAAIFIAYGCAALARKVRLRSTATALEGEHIDEGWFRPGHIIGRGFAVRIVPARRSFRTHVELSARSVPGPYLLDAGFFDAWPDWNHAKVPQVKRERAFFFSCDVSGLWSTNGRTAQRSLAMADARFERSAAVLRDADGREDQEDRRRGRARLNDL